MNFDAGNPKTTGPLAGAGLFSGRRLRMRVAVRSEEEDLRRNRSYSET